MTVPAGELLWAPPLDGTTAIERFGAAHGYTDYETLWKWSVTDLEGFWAAVWDWFGVLGTYDRVLSSHEMPGARWFDGASLNYAEHALRGSSGIIGRSQTRDRVELTADEMRRQVGACRAGLQRLGVSEPERGQVSFVDLDHRQIGLEVEADDGGVHGAAASRKDRTSVGRRRHFDAEPLCSSDNVGVGNDVTLGIDDDARA